MVWDQEIVSSNLATPTEVSSIGETFSFVKYTVYILLSRSIEKYYIGHTQNLENRIIEHNCGETVSIKRGIPWTIVWIKETSSRSEAMKLENWIKKRGAQRFLEDVSRGA